MAVTKTHPEEVVRLAHGVGLHLLGENRVQEAVEKVEGCRDLEELRWELIGHLQSNKTRVALEHFHRIQSVDRPKLLKTIDRLWSEMGDGGRYPVLLQVNAGDDPAKFGVSCDDAAALLETALAAEHVRVDGLMTIAPLDDDPDVARRCFERLREQRDALEQQFGVSLPELSMGMTDDLEQAVAAGSTLVRVGSALFGARETA